MLKRCNCFRPPWNITCGKRFRIGPSMNKAHRNKKGTWLAVFLMMAAPAVVWGAAGQQHVDTFYTTHTPHIILTNPTGTVVVKGWDRPQVYAVYIIASPRVEIDTEQVPSQGEAE